MLKPTQQQNFHFLALKSLYSFLQMHAQVQVILYESTALFLCSLYPMCSDLLAFVHVLYVSLLMDLVLPSVGSIY